MEEKVLKQANAQFYKSATSMIEGSLVLTNKRIFFSGTQARVQLGYGEAGQAIQGRLEDLFGIDRSEQFIFDIPVSEVSPSMKRFGLSKRLVITDGAQNEYKLMLQVKKAERDEWPAAIEAAR